MTPTRHKEISDISNGDVHQERWGNLHRWLPRLLDHEARQGKTQLQDLANYIDRYNQLLQLDEQTALGLLSTTIRDDLAETNPTVRSETLDHMTARVATDVTLVMIEILAAKQFEDIDISQIYDDPARRSRVVATLGRVA